MDAKYEIRMPRNHRINGSLDLLHLLKQRFLLSMPTRCVYNDDLKLLVAELRNTLFGDSHWISLSI